MQHMLFEDFDNFCNHFKINDIINSEMFKIAMTHSSVSKQHNYERLEFLGDTILNFCVSKMIFEKFSDDQEGSLSRMKSFLISRRVCKKIAKNIKLDTQIVSASTDHQCVDKETILADIVESFLCTVYYQYGLNKAYKIVEKLFYPYINSSETFDTKTKLQEITQKKYKALPDYSLISKTGPEHEPIFKVCVKCSNLYAEGIGKNKKNAEIIAAKNMLDIIKASKKNKQSSKNKQ